MKLKRIRIQQFRRFNDSLEFNDLDAGLNIFTGPNESGKSTIAQAIKVAFLERHNTGTLQDLLPWGESSSAPQVEIDFEHNNINYQLIKRFMNRKMCRLNINDNVLDGNEAENYLAEMLGFSIPSRGASQAKDWGIPGLLWVGQGLGQELSSSVMYANKPLQEVLNSAVDNVSSYDGDVILDRVADRLAQLVTPSNRNPTKDYKKALDQHQNLQQQLQEINQSIDLYKKQVDRLDYLRQEHTKNEIAKPWEEFKHQELASHKKLQRVQQLKQKLDSLMQQQQASKKSQELLHNQIDAINQQHKTLLEREAILKSAKDQLDLTTQQGGRLQDLYAKSEEENSLATQQLEKQYAINKLIQQNNNLIVLNTSLKQMQDRLHEANKIHKQLISNQQKLTQSYIDPQLIQQIQSLYEQQSKLTIQHNALATRLKITVLPNQKLILNNKEISQDIDAMVSENTTIEVPGVANIMVVPSAQDLQQIAVNLKSTQKKLKDSLSLAQVDNIEDLWQKQNNYQQAFDKDQQYQAMLKIHAPNGIEKINLELASVKQQAEEKQKAINDGIAQYGIDLESLKSIDIDISLENAKSHALKSKNKLQTIGIELQQYQLNLTKLQTQLESANIEYQRIKLICSDNQQQNAEKQALESLNYERAQYNNIVAQLDGLDTEIKAYAPDLIEQDIQRFKISAENQLNIQEQIRQEIIQISAELRVLGAQGLEEKLLEVKNQLNFVDKQVQQYQKTAQNLIRLFDLLVAKKQALILKLHQPLIKRMQAYLQIMFQQTMGDNDIKLNENLIPTTILRQNINTPIDDLSFGTREQIGIISRLSYADLLLESGKPTLILLDDALLHTDDNRLQQAKRVLFDAATRHQILLFTCQPDKWRDMGVIPKQLN